MVNRADFLCPLCGLLYPKHGASCSADPRDAEIERLKAELAGWSSGTFEKHYPAAAEAAMVRKAESRALAAEARVEVLTADNAALVQTNFEVRQEWGAAIAALSMVSEKLRAHRSGVLTNRDYTGEALAIIDALSAPTPTPAPGPLTSLSPEELAKVPPLGEDAIQEAFAQGARDVRAVRNPTQPPRTVPVAVVELALEALERTRKHALTYVFLNGAQLAWFAAELERNTNALRAAPGPKP